MRPRLFYRGTRVSPPQIRSLKARCYISAHFTQIFHLCIRTVLRYAFSITHYAIRKYCRLQPNTSYVSNERRPPQLESAADT